LRLVDDSNLHSLSYARAAQGHLLGVMASTIWDIRDHSAVTAQTEVSCEQVTLPVDSLRSAD
jgi:hypothetical protein